MEATILQGLNQPQRDAVLATEGRIRVIAGAGAGKTKTLAHRYAFLVNELGISPSHILCLTFTNKAAGEMRQRIMKMVDEGSVNDFICTIHGFCVKVLRRDIYRLGFTEKFIILDEEDRKSISKQVIDELELDKTVRNVLDDIERRKQGGAYIDNYLLPKSPKKPVNDNERALAAYCARQLKTFSLDFTDLVQIALYILRKYEDVRTYWQGTMEYIMLDEAQDCSDNDWELVEILSGKHQNLFIVGDPDQSIYGWRGANVRYFIDFENDRTIILNQNYRSTPNILNVANCIIRNNRERLEKDLFTSRDEGKTVIHFHGKNEVEEMQWVAQQISQAHEAGVNYRDFCILYRATNMSRLIEQELIKSHVLYKIYGGIRFYERKEIKDALSYLRMIEQNDDISFLRVINEPSRKLGKVFISKIEDYATSHQLSLYDALKEMVDQKLVVKESAVDFVTLIQAAKSKQYVLSISDLLEYILAESGYTEMLRMDGDKERLENLEELKHSIDSYEKANVNEVISLTTFLQDIALYTNTDADMSSDAVKLMTIHQSKGLEFPYVFVINLFDGGLPNYRAIREGKRKGLEEERRLMYVATTRAENALFLTESEGYDYSADGNKYPSRFLREIQRNMFVTEGKMDESLWSQTDRLIDEFENEADYEEEFALNDIVEHKHFGFGKVVKVNKDDTCTVLFKVGERTLKNSALEFVDNGDDRDIDFETGYPVDDIPFEVEGDEKEHQRMLMRAQLQSWKYFVGKSIIHPKWGKGTISGYVKDKPEGAVWEQTYFIVSFEGHGEQRVSSNALLNSLCGRN